MRRDKDLHCCSHVMLIWHACLEMIVTIHPGILVMYRTRACKRPNAATAQFSGSSGDGGRGWRESVQTEEGPGARIGARRVTSRRPER